MDKWNRTENAERNNSTCSQCIFDQDAKNIHCGKGQSVQQMVLGHGMSTCKKMNLDLYSHHPQD